MPTDSRDACVSAGNGGNNGDIGRAEFAVSPSRTLWWKYDVIEGWYGRLRTWVSRLDVVVAMMALKSGFFWCVGDLCLLGNRIAGHLARIFDFKLYADRKARKVNSFGAETRISVARPN